MTEVEDLTQQLAWRNAHMIEAANRRELRLALANIRKLAQAVLDARDKEASTLMALENAINNYTRHGVEPRAHEQAMTEASEADRALREALATPNV